MPCNKLGPGDLSLHLGSCPFLGPPCRRTGQAPRDQRSRRIVETSAQLRQSVV